MPKGCKGREVFSCAECRLLPGLVAGRKAPEGICKACCLRVQAPESRLQGTDDSVHKKVLAIFLIFTEYIVQDLYKISNYIIPSMAWFSSAKPPLQLFRDMPANS